MDKLRHIYEIADENVKVVGFSRNFGKESAIYAGLKESKGEMVCLIDADMQQRPELVLDMMAILDKDPNYDAVACYQEDRRESKVLSAFKDCFYKIINKTSEIEFKSGASDFRLLQTLCGRCRAQHERISSLLQGHFSWVGFSTYYMPYIVEDRANGTSKWNFAKLFKYAMDGIIAFTTTPLKIATYIGLTSSAASIIYMIVVIIQKLAFDIKVQVTPQPLCSFFCSAVFSFLHRHGRRVSCQNIY